ncbi:uncharacterized protein N7503_000518 [Penicillium pulvis]|uniref:uncharacterized protein n=1 Tax=Penicillium pulvis TaxID=1562058 RepID=UPI00254779D8|nr:uncharacterized protein N7503_000518 [Penicillium pulvis]KAJ5813768.1 hypothetical protein N7503_000518 [Penicillium pulvis]
MTEPKALACTDYSLAWICALPLELAAAQAMLEETHPSLTSTAITNITYTLGKIAGHNIVIACLPSGVYGTISATSVVSQIQSIFPNVRYGVMVGIGGGVPSETADIRLGDVVVSKPSGRLGGVVHYDLGKTVSGGHFEHTGMLNQPPTILLTAVSKIQARDMMRKDERILEEVSKVFRLHPDMEAKFSRPFKEDCLFPSTYSHLESQNSCVSCDFKQKVEREVRVSKEPQIHYGLIASGNRVIKDGGERDKLAQDFGALCFEMEAAGIMNHLPCLVVRGICDYCDSHKNKEWQEFAALVAAIHTKDLLSMIAVATCQPDESQKRRAWTVPFDRNPRFLGRNDEIRQLKQQILSKDHVRKAAISGLGGMGKTHIALELAYQVREDSTLSILWIPATSIEAVEQAFMSINELLGLPSGPTIDVKSQVKTYLSSQEVDPWLLIIDNADDADMWMSSHTVPALKNFLPQCHKGFILFTSRNQQLAIRLAGPNIIELSELSGATALDLLKELLVHKDQIEDSKSATVLVQQLCGLPLALIQAAGFINENCVSLEAYLTLLCEQEDTMIDLLSEDFEDSYRYTESKNPVAVTWMISFQQVKRLSDLAADILSFIACIDHRDIPLSLLPPRQSKLEEHKALGILKAYSFVTAQTNDEFISMHRLVHLATKNWLRNGCLLQEWTGKVGERFNTVFPSNDPINRFRWRAYLPHAQLWLQGKESQLDVDIKENLAQSVGKCLSADGREDEAETMFLKVLETRGERLALTDERLLATLACMASTYSMQGRLTEAEEVLLEVVAINKKVQGLDHCFTLTSMSDLALIYRDQGRLKESEELGLQVMETRKKILGIEHLDTLTSMGNITAIYYHHGRLKESEELELQILEARTRLQGIDHPKTLLSMSNLAMIYWVQGKLEEGEKFGMQSADATQRVLGVDHPETLRTMSNLALIYKDQGRFKESEELELQVMEARKSLLGVEHPDTLTSMGNLMLVYAEQGRLKESGDIGLKLMKARQKQLGMEHLTTLTSMSNLALVLGRHGRLKEAEELLKYTLETRKKVLGTNHLSTLTSMSNLAWNWIYQDRLVEAIAILDLCGRKQEQYLGKTHPYTIDTMAMLQSLQEAAVRNPVLEKYEEKPVTSTWMGLASPNSYPFRPQGSSKLSRLHELGSLHPLLSLLSAPGQQVRDNDDDIE